MCKFSVFFKLCTTLKQDLQKYQGREFGAIFLTATELCHLKVSSPFSSPLLCAYKDGGGMQKADRLQNYLICKVCVWCAHPMCACHGVCQCQLVCLMHVYVCVCVHVSVCVCRCWHMSHSMWLVCFSLNIIYNEASFRDCWHKPLAYSTHYIYVTYCCNSH